MKSISCVHHLRPRYWCEWCSRNVFYLHQINAYTRFMNTPDLCHHHFYFFTIFMCPPYLSLQTVQHDITKLILLLRLLYYHTEVSWVCILAREKVFLGASLLENALSVAWSFMICLFLVYSLSALWVYRLSTQEWPAAAIPARKSLFTSHKFDLSWM